jgi:integrase
MEKGTRVYVIRVGNRPNWHLEWQHPITGKRTRKVTHVPVALGKRGKAQAERLAKELEDQLRGGSADIPSKFLWDEFRRRYEELAVPAMAKASGVKIFSVFNAVETAVTPKLLRDLTPERISHFAATLRKRQLSESTIHSYLAHLHAALGWAVSQKMLPAIPTIPKPPRRKRGSKVQRMKGRPITQEEYERELEVVSRVVGEPRAAQWAWYMRGLWWSGLRLAESLELWWDRLDKIHPMFPKDGHPVLVVHAELEKGHQDRILPIAPEFAEMLLEVPESDRTGPVFPLDGRRGRLRSCEVSSTLSKIGKAAGVKVGVCPRTGKVKYASAHDFRRAFGTRWAARGISVNQLKELMRHENIETTQRYYVGMDAQQTADQAWAAYRRFQEATQLGFSDKSSDRGAVQRPLPPGPITPNEPETKGTSEIARLGFEPRQREPKSLVLPLHHRARAGGSRLIIPQ